MRISKAKRIAMRLLAIGQNPMFISPPGIGKTYLGKQIAADTNRIIKWSHPSISDPTDYKGLPALINNEAHFLPFNDLKELIDAKEPTMCFIDDVGQASNSTAAALMQLLWERRVNGFRLSDNVSFLLASNRAEDRAGVNGIIEPLKNRCAIIPIEFSMEDWVSWASENNVSPQTVGFNRFRSKYLEAPPAPSKEIVARCTPRTVEIFDRLYSSGIDDQDMYEACGSVVGEAYAVEWVAYLKVVEDLPTWEEIIKSPLKAKIPKSDSIGAKYAIATMLGRKADEKTIVPCIHYIQRLEAKEFEIMMVRDAIKQCDAITSCMDREVADYLSKNQKYILDQK